MTRLELLFAIRPPLLRTPAAALAFVFAFSISPLFGQGAPSDVVINELRKTVFINDDYYFELAGPPNTPLDGLSFIIVDSTGEIDYVQSLDGFSLGPDGYFVAAQTDFQLIPISEVDLVVPITFAPCTEFLDGSHLVETYLLVTDLTAICGAQLDTDFDNTLDITPWGEIVDQITVLDGSGDELTDFSPTIGPYSNGPTSLFTPRHILRCPDRTGDWTFSRGSTPWVDSPGSRNKCGVTNLNATVNCAGDVELTWTNEESYDEIFVYRFPLSPDNVTVLPGDATGFIDSNATFGEIEYQVDVLLQGTPNIERTHFELYYANYPSQTRIVVANELSGEATIDSATRIAESIERTTGLYPLVLSRLDLVCVGGTPENLESVFVANGTFPYAQPLTTEQGQILLDLLAQGVDVYLEGGDVFTFDPPTPFSEYDGVSNSIRDTGNDSNPAIGDGSLTAVAGLEFAGIDLSAISSTPYQQESFGADRNDQLIPSNGLSPSDLAGTHVESIWQNEPDSLPLPVAEFPYSVGIFYDTDAPFGKVISTSFEFGGLDEVTRDSAMEAYIDAFGGTRFNFIRGDTQPNGTIDLADPITILQFSFSGGALACADAADVDDDGEISISDPIRLLGYLFAANPPPTPNITGDCVFDVTGDPLDCGNYVDGVCP